MKFCVFFLNLHKRIRELIWFEVNQLYNMVHPWIPKYLTESKRETSNSKKRDWLKGQADGCWYCGKRGVYKEHQAGITKKKRTSSIKTTWNSIWVYNWSMMSWYPVFIADIMVQWIRQCWQKRVWVCEGLGFYAFTHSDT